jgi:uncharacterized protein involved in type VI secretion and phage assembly
VSILELSPREASLEAGGYVKGCAIAIVTQNRDTEGLGRVKLRFPWYSTTHESNWARVAVPMAGAEQGTYFLPEVGQEVLAIFEREDVRFPIVIGALWGGTAKSPIINSDGKNDQRVIRSRKKHHLLFDDGSKGVVELKLNDGKKVTIDDDGIRADDGQGNKFAIDSKSGAISIEAKGELSIKATSISIQATGALEMKSSATMTIQGSLVQIN